MVSKKKIAGVSLGIFVAFVAIGLTAVYLTTTVTKTEWSVTTITKTETLTTEITPPPITITKTETVTTTGGEYLELLKEYEELKGAYEALRRGMVESIRLLEDKEYYKTLLPMIEGANSTVLVAMYVIKYDPREPDDPVNMLLEALRGARERGLDVRVVVDDATLDSYPQTLIYLREGGIGVRLDESGRVRTHVKLVLIDGVYSFIGSHNWTESALSYNHEVSIMIESNTIYEELSSYFESIWDAGREM